METRVLNSEQARVLPFAIIDKRPSSCAGMEVMYRGSAWLAQAGVLKTSDDGAIHQRLLLEREGVRFDGDPINIALYECSFE